MANDGTMGYQFSPDQAQKRLLQAANQGGQLGPMANAALRILSLRLPTFLSGSPISPDALLRAKVGATPAPAATPTPAPLQTGAASGGSMNGGAMNIANFNGANVDPAPYLPTFDQARADGSFNRIPTVRPGNGNPGTSTTYTPPTSDTGEEFRRLFSSLLGGGLGRGPLQNEG